MTRSLLFLIVLSAVVSTRRAQAQGASALPYPQVAPGVYLIAEPTANMLVMVGADGPLVVGPPAHSLLTKARELLSSLHSPKPKYALITSGDSAVERRDGGWTKEGVITVAHEGIRNKLRWLARSDSSIREHVPTLGFSEVFQIAVDSDEVHAVHHPAGFSDADLVVHFEVRHFLYLGNLFTTDGYPALDLARGGSIAGLISTAKELLDQFGGHPQLVEPIVPGRGPLGTMRDLRDYYSMLVTLRGRIDSLVVTGKTLEEVIGSRPTTDFDARWGHGVIASDRFTALLYHSLTDQKSGGRK